MIQTTSMEAEILSKYLGKPLNQRDLAKMNPATLSNLRHYAQAIEAVRMAGSGIDPKTLLKKVLDVYGLDSSSKVFEILTPEDAFEIWSLDGRFVASSDQFFKITSWSLDDLLSKDRSELFLRDSAVQDEINKSLSEVLSYGRIVEKPCAPHLVHERKVGSVSVQVNMRMFAPVRHITSGMIAGVVAVVRFKQISN